MAIKRQQQQWRPKYLLIQSRHNRISASIRPSVRIRTIELKKNPWHKIFTQLEFSDAKPEIWRPFFCSSSSLAGNESTFFYHFFSFLCDHHFFSKYIFSRTKSDLKVSGFEPRTLIRFFFLFQFTKPPFQHVIFHFPILWFRKLFDAFLSFEHWMRHKILSKRFYFAQWNMNCVTLWANVLYVWGKSERRRQKNAKNDELSQRNKKKKHVSFQIAIIFNIWITIMLTISMLWGHY